MTPSIAQRWEQLIHSFFPQLKHFRFYFYVRIIHGSKPITSSFSTPFYLLEKKWFVRCDKFDNYSSYQSDMLYNNEGAVYSLPLLFQPSISMCNGNRVLSIDSTLPNALNNDDLYSNHFVNIKKLVFNGDPNYLDKNYKQNNIVNLTIQQSFTSHTWIQVLTKLRHLSLHKNAQMSTDIFHYLLEHTPELDSLVIDNNLLQNLTDNGNHSAICHHLSNKIRYLKFHSATNACQCFNKHKLSKILPIFASKCQHLSLSIQSKLDLICFVLKRMKRLHSLHIHMTEKDHQPINMEWFDEQKAKFSFSNCFIVKREQDYYFWLTKSY
ncbi:hypothetical protein I4U23_003540 [Adineta vaga]|nr:hypothetical protein I4U23_003540 [Adineta vaga]